MNAGGLLAAWAIGKAIFSVSLIAAHEGHAADAVKRDGGSLYNAPALGESQAKAQLNLHASAGFGAAERDVGEGGGAVVCGANVHAAANILRAGEASGAVGVLSAGEGDAV